VALDSALLELSERGLLGYDRERNVYDLHPIVRHYAYDRLADKSKVATTLSDYFAAVPTPSLDAIQRLDQLSPVIELFHHMVTAGRYEAASKLFAERLLEPLLHKFCAIRTYCALVETLFPADVDWPEQVKTLNDGLASALWLAHGYMLSGKPRKAELIYNHVLAAYSGKSSKSLAILHLDLYFICRLLGNLQDAGIHLLEAVKIAKVFRDGPCERLCAELSAQLALDEGRCADAQFHISNLDAEDAVAGSAAPSSYLREETRYVLAKSRGETDRLVEIARTALSVAKDRGVRMDQIRAGVLLGSALLAKAAAGTNERKGLLAEAEKLLAGSLTACRSLTFVELETDVLLLWARLHFLREEWARASECAEQALTLADHSEFRLKLAEIHNFKARLALVSGDREAASSAALLAREFAFCGKFPHIYKPAVDEAESLLGGSSQSAIA